MSRSAKLRLALRIGLGLTLLVLVIFRGSIFEWFSVGMSSSGDLFPVGVTHEGMEHDEPEREETIERLPYRFADDQLTGLREIFSAMEEVRIALSEDRVDTVPDAVNRIRTVVRVLENQPIPERIQNALEAIGSSARSLEDSASAVEARIPFGLLSEALFVFAESDPRLQEGWFAFSCPMVEGFTKWFQRTQAIENPYMGQQMLVCGVASDWSTAMVAPPPTPPADAIAHHTCSMHPSVRQQSSGTCPICNMDLTPVTHEDLQTGDVLVDSVRRQRIGVRTMSVTRRPLVHSIRAVGEVDWDESRLHDVTARVEGWVEDLRVTRVGDPVRRGAVLLRFYSPDLLASQRELLMASAGGGTAAAARERLRLWGMSNHAIRDMLQRQQPQQRVAIQSPLDGVVIEKHVNEGTHVAAGALLYRLVDTTRVWVVADVFERDLPHISVGQEIEVNISGTGTGSVRGAVDYIYPTVSSQTRTARVRVQLQNPEGQLRQGMIANIHFDVSLGEHLAVPTDAVIYTGGRRLVFVDRGEGRLRPVEIEMGTRTADWIMVRSGLSEGDIVVSSGVFLLAAESRIRSATEYWEASDAAE